MHGREEDGEKIKIRKREGAVAGGEGLLSRLVIPTRTNVLIPVGNSNQDKRVDLLYLLGFRTGIKDPSSPLTFTTGTKGAL